jgi:hypothetical protein
VIYDHALCSHYDGHSIQTPSLRYDGEICLSFAYMMDGEGLGNMFVYVEHDGIAQMDQVWARGRAIEDWKVEDIDVTIQRHDRVSH